VVKPQNPLPGFVDPLTRSGQRIPITLDACLRRALANNLTVQVARYGPPIARTVVRENEAMFDPSWFLNSAVSRLKQQAGNFFAGANVVIGKQWDFSTGLESLLPTGATVALTQDWTWQQSNSAFIFPNPQYVPDLTLSARQPLLRGGGVEVTTSPIVLARLDETISTEEFKLRLMDTILDVEMTYWNLVVAETQVQALNEAIDAARENLRIAQRRFEEGKDLRVVVSLAQSAVTSRQADLVAARLALARTSDRLKRLINDPQLPLVQPVVLAAAEVPMAEPAPVGLPLLHQSMVAAMSYRPELQQAEARVSKADIGERVAKNNRLPQLDFVAAYGLNGLGTHLDRGLDSEFTAQYYQWQAGVDFSVPIGNRARTAAYRRSQLTEEQSLRDREDVRQRVLLDVSDAVHNLAAAAEAILARRAAREAAEQTLKDEQAFVGAGAALLKDLLDAQRDLADAKVREMQAMANYMVGLAALERAKGTLLEYNNLRLVEESGGLPAAVRQPPAAVQQPPGAVQQPPAK
jgi:outer membrane protein TolC